MLKKLIDKAFHEGSVPSGTLQAKDVEPRLAAHNGLPATATLLAFEPVQRLLAIGSTDGRIKVLGGNVDRLFQSPSKAPCRLLQFIVNKGLLVHITTKSDVEVWNLETGALQASCEWPSTITAVAAVPGTFYLYVGDDQGVVRVLNVECVNGIIVPLPYLIPPTATLAGLVRPRSLNVPSVVAILPQPDAQHSRILLAYQNGLLVLWALHEKRVVAIRGGTEYQRSRLTAIPGIEAPVSEDEDEEEEQHLCAICWADGQGSLVAAGYDNGDVWLVSFPPGKSAMGDAEGCIVEPARAIQLSKSESRMPVTILKWCAGDKSTAKAGRVYIFGGGEMGKPESISVVSLTLDSTPADEAYPPFLHRELPWFGPIADLVLAPVAGGDSSSPATAVIVLTSPGEVNLYDEASIATILAQGLPHNKPPPVMPGPVGMTRDMLPALTAASAVMGQPGAQGLETVLRLPRMSSGPPSSLPSGAKWPVSGGIPGAVRQLEEGDSTWWCALLVGQESGETQLWDASNLKLSHITNAPNPAVKEAHPLHAVTCLDFCPVSGLLAVGHQGGMVRLYVASKEPRRLARRSIDQNGQVKKEFMDMAPGFQCLVTSQMHTATVRSVAIASGPGKIAFGDEDGMVSIFDITSGTFAYMDRPFPGTAASIIALAFTSFSPAAPQEPPKLKTTHESVLSPPMSPPREAAPLPSENTVVLYAASATAAVAVMDATSGGPIGAGALLTKNPSTGIALYILDGAGHPMPPLSGPLWCPWATGDAPLSSPTAKAHEATKAAEKVADDLPESPRGKSNGSPRKRKKEKAALRDESEANYVLLVSEECLRLYTTRAIAADKKAERKAVRKELLKGSECARSLVFGQRELYPSGLVIVTSAATMQIRSLPSLDVVVDVSLSDCLGWEVHPPSKLLAAASATPDGRLLLKSSDTELVRVSLLAEENALSLPASLPTLHDHVVAAAADAAAEAAAATSAAVIPPASPPVEPPSPKLLAPGPPPKRKSFKDVAPWLKAAGTISTMMKTVTKDLLGEVKLPPPPKDLPPLTAHTADELHGLFATAPFLYVALSKEPEPVLSAPAQRVKAADIEVDDLDIDEEDTHEPTDLGKEKKKPEMDRAKLFGNLDKGEAPRARTADEIRAAYGHARRAADAAGTAAEARNKLLERQEKLENIGSKAESLNAGAANFADMAAELAKRMEKKKWYHI